MEPLHQPRYDQLDSLRGIAALSVVFSHFTLMGPLLFLRKTPLRLLCGGHEAVVLFFMLSGFVLTLQLSKKNHITYMPYMIRRICRIYIPYLAAIGISVMVFSTCFNGEVTWAGDWFNRSWNASLGINDISNHLRFLGQYPTSHLVPVIWSLVYEMRISLVFPLVVIFIVSAPSLLVFLTAALLSAMVFFVFNKTGIDPIQASINVYWLMTLHYLFMFVIGGLLAKHRYAIFHHISTHRRNVVVLLLGIVFYFFSRPMTMRVEGTLNGFLFDWFITLGAAGLITSTITFAPLARLLTAKPLIYLGHISFSMYLFHTIVLLGIVHYFVGPPLLILALAFILVFPVSALAYHFIEKPTIRIGTLLGQTSVPIVETTRIV